MPLMDDFRRLEAKGLARAKIRAKRRRVSSIRGRTIRGSLALFAVAWSIVFIQLVTGNDPALSRSYKTTATLADANHHRKHSAAAPPVEPEPEPAVEEVAAPEEEFVPEVEEEAAPEEEFVPEEEVVEEAAPEVEVAPEPVVTASS
jgi:hypothetical protein